jgi:transketolase
MRAALSKSLVAAADRDPRIILLTGDHGYALFDQFRQHHPDKYLNAGIAEQNMVGVASGLAKAGFRPIVYGLSAFIPIRVLEQIKIDVAHDNLPVTFLGDGAGFVYSHLGTSHQSTEDIACLRAVPNVTIYSPADATELDICFADALVKEKTAYIRIGKADKPPVHETHLDDYKTGDLLPILISENQTAVVIATGSMVSTANELAAKFKQISVWSAPTLKPVNIENILSATSNVSVVITLEEHSIYGGLGSIVSEVLSARAPKRVISIGIQDRFSHGCGSYQYLLEEHGLDTKAIEKRVGLIMEELRPDGNI